MRVEHIGDATLIHGDCLDFFEADEAKRFDALVTDPPYGIKESSRKVASRGKLAKPRDYGEFDWDSERSTLRVAAAASKTQWQIIFGGNYYPLPETSCWLVWDKQNGTNDFADCELAWTNLNKAVRRIYWRWNGMIRKGDDVREHPTQKPVGVMEWCIGHLPADAHTILDPFMGSGTTGVACAKLGRKFIGVEIDEKYFEIACKRIEEAYNQPDMFIESPSKPIQTDMLA